MRPLFKHRRPSQRSALLESILVAGILALGAVPTAEATSENQRVRSHDEATGPDDGCTLASLNGTYGFTGTGTIVGEGPVASVGIISFDGQGNVFLDFTQSRNGVINDQSPAGTYTVDSSCRGSWVLSNGSTVDLVIVDGGSELMTIRTNPGVVITAVAKRQFRHRDD